MLFVDLPLMLAGPLLRRVEPNLVSVWVALKESLASGPDPAVQILPFGQQLHVEVVTSELSVDETLQPDRNLSFEMMLNRGECAATKTRGLLRNDWAALGLDMNHSAVGFETQMLPMFSFSPSRRTSWHVAHCTRRGANNL